jgi:hypothetical protein
MDDDAIIRRLDAIDTALRRIAKAIEQLVDRPPMLLSNVKETPTPLSPKRSKP